MAIETAPFWWTNFVLAWFILFPAFAANGLPVLARGKRSLDFGKSWRGNRIFGNSKTIEGTAVGIVGGFLVGALEWYLLPQLQLYAGQFGVQLPAITLAAALALGVGTMVGDIFGSFVKRRLGMPAGSEAPLLDQLGFIVFAIIFVYPFVQITTAMILYALAISLVAHKLVNYMSYRAKLKNVPW